VAKVTSDVVAPSFTLSVTDSSGGVVSEGAPVQATVRLTSGNAISATATLAATDLPDCLTASFTPGQVSTAAPATLTLTPSSDCAGTYTIKVVGTLQTPASGALTAEYTVSFSGPAGPGEP
jgi:hypothetical protein